MPKVSIIVPVYNVEKYLDRCMQSLLNQTLRDIEIIMVDDESPDNCPKMCDEYAEKDERVKVVHKKNGGLGMACNSGLSVSTGEYVAWCDSDDYVDLDMYEMLYFAAVENAADVVLSGIKTVDEYGRVKPMSQPENNVTIRAKDKINSYILDMIASEPSETEERMVPMSAKINLYRRGLLADNDLHFESERKFISEDLLWNMDVLAHSTCIVTVAKSFYYYFYNRTSLSKKVSLDRFSFLKSIRNEVVRRAQELGVQGDVSVRANRMFIGYSRSYIGRIVQSDLDVSLKIQLVKDICRDSVFKEIWKEYPIGKMPVNHKIFAYLMKANLYVLIYIIVKLK